MAAGVSEEALSRRASPQPQQPQQQQCIVVVAAWREFCAAATPSNIPLRSGLVHRLSRRMELLTKRWPGSTICELTTSMMKEAEAWERWRRGRRGREELEAPHSTQHSAAWLLSIDQSRPAGSLTRRTPRKTLPFCRSFVGGSFAAAWPPSPPPLPPSLRLVVVASLARSSPAAPLPPRLPSSSCCAYRVLVLQRRSCE